MFNFKLESVAVILFPLRIVGARLSLDIVRDVADDFQGNIDQELASHRLA